MCVCLQESLANAR